MAATLPAQKLNALPPPPKVEAWFHLGVTSEFAALWRTLRSWRWRAAFAAMLGAAYWFGTGTGFGEGAAVFFPGGPVGVRAFTIALAGVALLLGIDVQSQWDRQRARKLLESRIASSWSIVNARALAATVAGSIIALVIAFAAPLLALRGGGLVLWEPTILYLLLTALPTIWIGVTSGMLARTWLRSDLAAMVLGAAALAPLLYWVLSVTPPEDFFLLASRSLGVLLPTDLLILYALPMGAVSLTMLGLTIFSTPAPRLRSMLGARLPLISKLLLRTGTQWRQHSRWQRLLVAATLVCGATALPLIVVLWPRTLVVFDAESAREPEGTADSVIAPVEVRHRMLQFDKHIALSEAMLEIYPLRETAALAAFDFGPYLRAVAVKSETEQTVTLVDGAAGARGTACVVRFDPPMRRGERTLLRVAFLRSPASVLAWQRAAHPAFFRFTSLGTWYGEPLAINYRTREVLRGSTPSPTTFLLPDPGGLTWSLGAQKAERVLDGWFLNVTGAVDPSRLIAGRMVSVPAPDPALGDVSFQLLASRDTLAQQLHRIYDAPLRRLHRLLGPQAMALAMVEVPEQNPANPLAISSATLDRLESLLLNFNTYEAPTAPEFYRTFVPLYAALLREGFIGGFGTIEEPELLRDGLVEYLARHAMGEAGGAVQEWDRRLNRDFVFVPWKFARMGAYPFDVLGRDEALWRGPALARERTASPSLARMMAFHHMLRGMLGDDKFLMALRQLIDDGARTPLTLASYRAALESAYGEPLDWFFVQWLRDGVLPDYRIVEAQAFLFENRASRALRYQTKVILKNAGTGRMPVPWILATEGDPLEGTRWMDAGEQVELNLETLDRPVAFEVDPDGWVAQRFTPDPAAKLRTHPRVIFKTVTQL